MDIREKLNRLAELEAQADVLRLHFQGLRDAVLTQEQREQLADIDAEQQTALDAIKGGIDSLTAEIKAEVVGMGATVKGDHLQAVWTKGRVSWDTKALDGYAAGHPELLPFRKEGDPSVSIRKA